MDARIVAWLNAHKAEHMAISPALVLWRFQTDDGDFQTVLTHDHAYDKETDVFLLTAQNAPDALRVLEDTCKPSQVYAIVVNHRHGVSLCLGKTQADAFAQLHAYVEDNWDETRLEEMPDVADEAIHAYFGAQPDEDYDDQGFVDL